MELNDELLSAYLDGELDATGRARVEAALEGDAGGRVRLERMRVADARLRREVPPVRSGARDPIAEYIQQYESRAVSAAPRRRWVAPLAMAAAAACVSFGFVLAQLVSADSISTGQYARGDLRRALESQPSGAATAGSATVASTLRASDGSWCRVFEMPRGGSAVEGLACRDAQGWRVVAWDSTMTPGAEYRPAAGAGAIVDAAIERLGGDLVDSAEEGAQLARGWSESGS